MANRPSHTVTTPRGAAAGVLIAGDDFKSGQTKIKSVLVDFLVGAGIKPTAIVSYNHLGNNDGMNLSAPQTFRSKEISKSNVVRAPCWDNICVESRWMRMERGVQRRALKKYNWSHGCGGTQSVQGGEDGVLGLALALPYPCPPGEAVMGVTGFAQVDDVVASNALLYSPGEAPDHTVVIKYVPYVADSKRALDEYSAEARPWERQAYGGSGCKGRTEGVCLLGVLLERRVGSIS